MLTAMLVAASTSGLPPSASAPNALIAIAGARCESRVNTPAFSIASSHTNLVRVTIAVTNRRMSCLATKLATQARITRSVIPAANATAAAVSAGTPRASSNSPSQLSKSSIIGVTFYRAGRGLSTLQSPPGGKCPENFNPTVRRWRDAPAARVPPPRRR